MTREESEQPLDKHIRETLSPMRPAYKAKSWDELSRKLDNELMDGDALFDQAVRNQLGRAHLPHRRRRGWHRLVLQLELEYRRTRAVVSCKLLEFIAALLLLLLISPREESAPQAASTPSQPTNVSASPAITATQNQTAKFGAANNFGHTNRRATSRAFAPSSQATDKSVEALSTIPSAAEDMKGVISGQFGIAMNVSSLASPLPASAIIVGRPTLLATLRKPVAIPKINIALPQPLAGSVVGADENERVKKTYLRMGPVGGPDYLRVITPPTTVGFDTLISLDRYAAGFHGGFTLGIEHGRWELETGLIYAVRRYTPIPVLYVSGNLRTGFFAAGLHNFEFNTVNIPINGRINLLMRNQWRVYALSGVSVNMILEANYYTAGESAFSTSFLRPPSGNNGRNEPGLPGSLEDKLTKGWLEGGRFLDNTTLYGNIGGGVERYMSPVWSLFSQTVYQHSLYDLHGGVGPYKDRIHALSIMLGVKVRL